MHKNSLAILIGLRYIVQRKAQHPFSFGNKINLTIENDAHFGA